MLERNFKGCLKGEKGSRKYREFSAASRLKVKKLRKLKLDKKYLLDAAFADFSRFIFKRN